MPPASSGPCGRWPRNREIRSRTLGRRPQADEPLCNYSVGVSNIIASDSFGSQLGRRHEHQLELLDG